MESRRWGSLIARPGYTSTEVALLIVVSVLLIAVVVQVVRFSGSPDRHRAVCPANLKNMGIGMVSYANENANVWPIAAHAPAEQPDIGRVSYAPGKIGMYRGSPDDSSSGETTETDTEMSTTRNLWVMVRVGSASTKQLICPNTPHDSPNDEENPQAFRDFRSWKEISYGYQVPYGKLGAPNNNLDQEMALIADKGPFGAALEAGFPNPGVPTLTSRDAPEKWRPWNSPNHNREGQNVLFTDGHVEWFNTPLAGVKNDNIYTRWSNETGGGPDDERPRVQGTPPTSNETPWSRTDSLIYP